ncbi:TPA: hypothetical protein QDA71_003412 [Burkholderia vietnamiensis]|uniref:hypothetical protein n=1 Tax=Burkholderia vietnamiensis TaxID=60552 RepID=UPI000ADAA331|nr:hypothetical protein [Burkholderia vietnamiensis]MBR8164189.1 hypothetical protein [Burkholderia vietnamiensis]MCA8149694.1 hypothetical protein [Burkholderia vietnamiensis]HDR8946399.1 hypothetical protein [Burkholderia vietnamiensis]HDR9088939.1 hypothetical protein [Burkholderia vietnamiensis]HDR9127912.1 hypothetical protein [Burkholderia vietnamiensis]
MNAEVRRPAAAGSINNNTKPGETHMNARRIGIALLTLSLTSGARAQSLARDMLAQGTPLIDNPATTTVPSVIRPSVDARTHRMRLRVKLSRSYETRQTTDLEKAWGNAGPGTLAGTITTSNSAEMPGDMSMPEGGAMFSSLASGPIPAISAASGSTDISGLGGTYGTYGAASVMGGALPRSQVPLSLPSGTALLAPLRSSASGDLH